MSMDRRAVLAALFFANATVAVGAEPHPEGDVRFYQLAKSNFDSYTQDPSPATIQWMHDHYLLMQTYSPYFDSRLSWFPNAWVYKDSYAIYPNSSVDDEHPEWILKDAEGNWLYIPFACHGGTCTQYAADFGNQAFRDDWIARAVELIEDIGYQGLWIDDVNLAWRVGNGNGDHVTPIDPRTGTLMTLDDWQRYFAEFMEQVRAALPGVPIAHNAIWYVDPDRDNPYVLRQIDAADYYNLERGATDGGLVAGSGTYGFETFLGFIDFIHDRGRNVILMDEADDTDERIYALVGWFLVNDGLDLVTTEHVEWTTPDGWWPGYGLKMGPADGDRYTWQGLIRRDFACGSVFLNQPGRPSVTAALGETLTTLDNQSVASVTLGGDRATILLRDCDPDPPPAPPTNLNID